jgi:hypothetical protein
MLADPGVPIGRPIRTAPVLVPDPAPPTTGAPVSGLMPDE